MPTEVELKAGLNLEIGSVPVALDAEFSDTDASRVFTFDGSVTDVEIDLARFLSYVGSQFQVDVELPSELKIDAKIDYVVGQVIYTKPKTGATTTELGAAAKFELDVGDKQFAFQFYADSIIESGQSGKQKTYVVGAAIDEQLAFKELPLVGDVPGVNELALTQIGFSYTNNKSGKSFNVPKVAETDNPLYTGNEDSKDAKTWSISNNGKDAKFNLNKKGFSLTVGLENVSTGETLKNFALPMSMPSAKPPPPDVPAPYYAEKTSPPASSVHYVDINKSFGPVELKKIGLNYADGEATFGISGGFSMAGFSMDLQGLTITFPMPLPGTPAGNHVGFGLDGLGFLFSKGNLTIGGGFLRQTDEHDISHYYGGLLINFSSFGMRAIGGYTPAQQGNPASFFIYVNVNIPLGGPPFLFVTGLAGGFGVNSQLVLPDADDLYKYPLLPQNAPSQPGKASDVSSSVMPALSGAFVDKPGQYWVAAGIQFTSFEMIDAFAVLTISFGVDLQIAVLGSVTMTFPKGSPYPVAFIKVDLMASFTPSTGLLAVEGRVSPESFIYGGFVKLSGGFAFYAWVSGPSKGDFVVSLGGYAPGFDKPAHYPSVPRLEMNFALGPFKVTGKAYFALTPAMMMAGIEMSAVWDSGPIKAWFDAGANFLIAWKPFHYEANIYVNIGVTADLGLFSIDVHIGADLEVWGPAFGGRATVDLDVVSFTINFGAAVEGPPPVGWETFKSDFLPKDNKVSQAKHESSLVATSTTSPQNVSNIIKASVGEGLVKTDEEGFDWIIDSGHFSITTNSVIPANHGQWQTSASETFPIPADPSKYNSETIANPYLKLPKDTKVFKSNEIWNPDVSIGPMEEDHVQSFHQVEVKKRTDHDPAGKFSDYISDLSITPVVLPSSAALWAKNIAPKDKTPNDQSLIPSALTGFVITPIPRNPNKVSNVPLIQLLFAGGFGTGFSWQKAAPNSDYQVTGELVDNPNDPGNQNLNISIGGAHTEKMQETDYLLSSLANSWVKAQRNTIADDLLQNGFDTYEPHEIHLYDMATKKQLTDWPYVELLGSY